MNSPSESPVFQALFQAARKGYEEQTGANFIEHPLAVQLQTCHTFECLIVLLQEQARAFHEFRAGDGKVMISLNHICMSS